MEHEIARRIHVIRDHREDVTKPQLVESMQRLLKRCLFRLWDAALCEDIRTVLKLFDALENPPKRSNGHNLGVDGLLPPDDDDDDDDDESVH